MGVLYSIPFCSRETVKINENEEQIGSNVVDKNNNDPSLVIINNQPLNLLPSTKITSSSTIIHSSPPNATSTPKRAGSCASNEEEDIPTETGFQNHNAGHFAIDENDDGGGGRHCHGPEGVGHINVQQDQDAIGPAVDQVIGGRSSDDELGDSGLGNSSVSVEHTLDAFRKRHNLDHIIGTERSVMTPTPPHLHTVHDAYDECFDDILCNDEEEEDYDDENEEPNLAEQEEDDSDACCSISDDATINVEDVDSRDMSSSDTDPVERPPEPQPVQHEISREVSPFYAPSPNVSVKDGDELLDDPEEGDEIPLGGDSEVGRKTDDATTHAISSMLSELVGDTPHRSDRHSNVAISR